MPENKKAKFYDAVELALAIFQSDVGKKYWQDMTDEFLYKSDRETHWRRSAKYSGKVGSSGLKGIGGAFLASLIPEVGLTLAAMSLAAGGFMMVRNQYLSNREASLAARKKDAAAEVSQVLKASANHVDVPAARDAINKLVATERGESALLDAVIFRHQHDTGALAGLEEAAIAYALSCYIEEKAKKEGIDFKQVMHGVLVKRDQDTGQNLRDTDESGNANDIRDDNVKGPNASPIPG